MAFGLQRAKVLGYLTVQLVSKISNLCGPDPPTLQTDRRTDGRHASQYRALHYSASRGNNWYIIIWIMFIESGLSRQFSYSPDTDRFSKFFHWNSAEKSHRDRVTCQTRLLRRKIILDNNNMKRSWNQLVYNDSSAILWVCIAIVIHNVQVIVLVAFLNE